MVKKEDEVLDIMFEYLDYAKNLLRDDGDLMPTVFAHSRVGTIVLPIYHPEGETSEKATDLIGKVVCAYNCYEYYVVVESYKFMDEPNKNEQLEECVNILYVTEDECRVICNAFRRVGLDIHFGQPVEIKPQLVEGSITKLFTFYDCDLTETEKNHIRIMFPIQSEDDLFAATDDSLN